MKSHSSLWKCTPKKYSSRQLSAFGQYPAKSLASVRKCTPKRRSGQTTSGCLFPPIVRLPKRPVAMTRKRVAPDSLRLWIYTEQKVSPAFGDLPRKNVHARQPSALGRYPAKSPTSLRNCALKRRSGQAASSFGEILCEKPLQPLEMYPEKTFRSDNLRLPFPTDREAPQVARCDNPKKCSSGQPSALDLY